MARLLLMPAISAGATSATLLTWTTHPGERFSPGHCLAEIETDKATVELPAEESGVLGQQLVSEGQPVEVGMPICVLLSAKDEPVDLVALLAASGAATTGSDHQPASVQPPAERLFSSPLARRIARTNGLDLRGIAGSGPGGRIVRRDVDAAAASRRAAPVAGSRGQTPYSLSPAIEGVAYSEIPHSRTRQTIARRVAESKATIPHFYLDADLRVDRLLALRREINASGTPKISVTDFVVRATAVALTQVPEANVSWLAAAMRQYTHADIAVAVSTDTGLITPVVRAAETKPLSVLSTEISDLADRARAGKLRPDEFEGGSFTVSNLGMYGVKSFLAIINPPQSAILAVGAARKSPIVVDDDDSLSVGTIMTCTLSADHRAIDGALAARWLAVFKSLIENPVRLLV